MSKTMQGEIMIFRRFRNQICTTVPDVFFSQLEISQLFLAKSVFDSISNFSKIIAKGRYTETQYLEEFPSIHFLFCFFIFV